MDSIEFTLQLLSTIFTVLGVIVAVSSVDTRWSLAAVLGRRIGGRNIDWEGERQRWQEMYDIESQEAFLNRNQCEGHGEPDDTVRPSRTWSALSDATIAAKDCTNFIAKLDNHDHKSNIQAQLVACLPSPHRSASINNVSGRNDAGSGTASNTLNNRQPTRPQQSQHDRQRKPRLVMWPRGRRNSGREAATSKAPVYVSNICTTAA